MSDKEPTETVPSTIVEKDSKDKKHLKVADRLAAIVALFMFVFWSFVAIRHHDVSTPDLSAAVSVDASVKTPDMGIQPDGSRDAK